MKEFVTAVAAHEDESKEGWVEFKVDGTDCRAKRPTPGQVAYLTASMHKRAAIDTQVSGIINFCMAIMDTDTAAYLSDRLLDAEDSFEIPQIQDIIEYLLEEWTARPTVPSSDSSQPPDTSGPTSTETVPTTSSTSASIAS